MRSARSCRAFARHVRSENPQRTCDAANFHRSSPVAQPLLVAGTNASRWSCTTGCQGEAMRIRRSTLRCLRGLMVLGLARVAGAQTQDPVDTRSASVIAQPPEAGVPAARSQRGGVEVAVKSTRGPAPLGV